jgi:(1->4)-alpha-D-glucan 1-alpha-D-glucosylmutase
LAPNEPYESAAAGLIRSLFSERSDLLNELAVFAHRIGSRGAANGLAQALIKLTAPGIPDIYQGTEYWDLSLVDPDNRAPVAFRPRKRSLDRTAPADRASTWCDGRVKQAMIERILAVRKEAPSLFSDGKYLPLATAGPFAQNIVAFARTCQSSVAIVASIRWPTHVLDSERAIAPTENRWRNTRVVLPDSLSPFTASSVLHRSKKVSIDKILNAADIFDLLPVACLINEKS